MYSRRFICKGRVWKEVLQKEKIALIKEVEAVFQVVFIFTTLRGPHAYEVPFIVIMYNV